MKKKLTLSVNEHTLNKAKIIGINLSEVMDKILENLPELDLEDTDKEQLEKSYIDFWKATTPILKKYGTNLEIGSINDETDLPNRFHISKVVLNGSGNFYSIHDYTGEWHLVKENNPFRLEGFGYLCEPTAILNNLIDAIISAKKKNKEKIEQLIQAKQVIENMKPLLLRGKSENIINSRIKTKK